MSNNPYAAPTATDDAASLTDSRGDELARRFTRLAAAMVDGLLVMAITLPVGIATGFDVRAQTQQVGLLEQLAMVALGVIVMLALQGYLLALVDGLFIFGKERRCLHDYIAGSKVIRVTPQPAMPA